MSTKRTYKFGTKDFLRATPSLFRRIGNMFFSVSSLGGTYAFLVEDKKIGFILFAVGVLGKVLTEFFSQEELEKDYEDVDTPDLTPSEELHVHIDTNKTCSDEENGETDKNKEAGSVD